MELIVPDDKLSLAIGKKGQNVRLASQLTGWRIDIHSESKVREMEERSRVSMAAIEGVGAEVADTLFKLGWRSAADVANAKPEELAAVAGIGSADAAKQVIASAARAAEIERKQHAEEVARIAQAEQEALANERAAAAASSAEGRRAVRRGARRGRKRWLEIKMGTAKGFPSPAATRGGAAPVRTCVGCRKACPSTELVRMVLRDGQPVVDARRTLPGRGASIHPRAACVTAAIRQGGIGPRLSMSGGRGCAGGAVEERCGRVWGSA